MSIQCMDQVGIVVDDLPAAIGFFVALGLEPQGEGHVEGELVDRVVGLEGVRSEIAMLQTKDGHGRIELSKFHSPPAQGQTVRSPLAQDDASHAPPARGEALHSPAHQDEAQPAPANTPGIRHISFEVEDISRRRPAGRSPDRSPHRARRRSRVLQGRLPPLLRPRPGGDHRGTGGADWVRAPRS